MSHRRSNQVRILSPEGYRKQPPHDMEERALVVCDRHPARFTLGGEEYYLLMPGETVEDVRGPMQHAVALPQLQKLLDLQERDAAILLGRAESFGAAARHTKTGETLSDRWDLAAYLPPDVWRGLAISWWPGQTPPPITPGMF